MSDQPTMGGPVPVEQRITALDAARGVALLGIFLVNIQLFFEPFGTLMNFRPPTDKDAGDQVVWWFVKIFCEGKFYPLFSMLFGMGLVLQLERAQVAGRRFAPLYLRRLAVLAVFGIGHIVLLWAGDILLVYSVAGLVLLLFSRLSARGLMIGSAVFLSIAILLTFLAAGLGFFGDPSRAEPAASVAQPAPQEPSAVTPESAPPSSPATAIPDGAPAPDADENDKFKDEFWQTPFGRLIRGFKSGTVVKGPADPLWMQTEREAFSQGPYSQGLLFRVLTFASFVGFMLFGFGWHVLAMFFLGAALMKARIFAPERRAWHRRFVMIGALAALPCITLTVALPLVTEGSWVMLVMAPVSFVVSPLISLAYLGAVTLLVTGGSVPVLASPVAAAGRAALTVYLGETLVATFFSYSWGLGWYGSLNGPERMVFVVLVFLALAVFANVWLRIFRYGPMEWLWRTLTYLRAPRMST